MKIVAISDTHNQHLDLHLPSGDMLIHAGDISGRGHPHEVENFIDWFAAQDFEYKIFIAGNHDFFFEKYPKEEIKRLLHPEIIYLNDEGLAIKGLQIWGSPVQPWFYNWAFNRQRGEQIDRHWQLIPENTDILITHGPAFGILDQTVGGDFVGCRKLKKRIDEIEPRLHICGHIHEAHGVIETEKTTFVNASVLNFQYQLVNDPVIIEL